MNLQNLTSTFLRNRINRILILTIVFHASIQISLSQNTSSNANKLNASIKKDTLFCSNIPYATVVVTNKKGKEINEQAFLALGSIEPSLIVNRIHVKQSKSNDFVYHHFNFNGLKLTCDIKETLNGLTVAEEICKSTLFNKDGLDTLKAEIFATLKGKIKVENGVGILASDVNPEKGYILERNKESPVLVQDDIIAQDGQGIGRFELDTISGVDGDLKQVKIFNSLSALIFTATRTDAVYNTWSILTYKDNRFQTINIKGEDEVVELCNYLIASSFL
ncbi:MAG: hypothetical protein R2852_05615 [Bacteroidia bacterium]